MSKKRNDTKASNPSHDWLAPVDNAAPCGADLEYDPEFVVLFARVAAKMDAQYGDFVGTAEPVNWSEIDRDCRRLMMRSKDMRLAVLFTRCRTRLAGAGGLTEGLALLAAWLTTFPDTVHPQPGVDEDHDAALEIRMNALQGLTDADGLLSDVREIALARSSAARLQVRDVERAFAQPRPNDALSVESVTQQLRELRVQQPEAIAGFDHAVESLEVIDAWNHAQLGVFSADLSTLKRTLRRVVGEGPVSPGPAVATDDVPMNEMSEETTRVDATPNEAPTPDAPLFDQIVVSSTLVSGRESALRAMRDARQWFETHEPSSPIPVLLRRAEQFVGRRYADVVKAIPAELLAEWDADHQ